MVTKALVIDAGTTKRVPDAETLVVGAGIDAATATTLTIGGTTATSITLGSATIPVTIPGDVTTVGGTTFTTDATFEGNVTVGNAATDLVTFVSKVNSNIAFNAPGYRITNMLDPTGPSTQEGATAAWVTSQIAAIPAGVSSFQTSLSGLTPSTSTTGAVTLAGTLGVASGGTGAATLTGYVKGSGTAALTASASIPGSDVSGNISGNAANVTGIVAIANGGTGVTTVPTNGQLLIGNGTGYAVAGLTAGSGVSITNGAGTITIAATGSGGTITGSGTATQIAYFTGASAIGSEAASGSDAFTWDATNNALGIRVSGALTAGASLDVASGQIAIPDGTALLPAIAFRDDLNTGFFSPANDTLGFSVNGTEIGRMQQTGAGLTPALLLGTTAPIGAISGSGNISVDSSDPSATSGVVMLAHGQNPPAIGTTIQESYRGGQFAGVRTLGTKTAPSQVLTNTGLWNAVGAGYTATGGYNYGALITFKAEQSYTSTASGGRIEFHTTLNGTSGTATLGGSTTERMRIANDGRVSIGTTAATHTFNIGSGASANFCVASGGRIHTYDGTAPTDGQVLIGDTALGNFAKATLTAGANVSITNGAGSVTIAAGTVTLTTAQAANTAVTVAGAAAIATAASTSRVAGIVTATNTVQVLGVCTCIVEGALSIAAGDAVYLSATEAGKVTNVAPSTATQVVAELGIATAADASGTVTVLWQPKSIVVL